eukprot:5841705-Lingulodinium_polyedra.AAC.1
MCIRDRRTGAGSRCIALELNTEPGRPRSIDEPAISALGTYVAHPEFQILTPRSTQDMAEAWITHLESAALRAGGFL